MPTRRQLRLNEMLLEEMSLLVPGQMDDPRLTSVRITRIETARDMSTAKVYFTRLEPEQPVEEIYAALQHAAGRLCVELTAVGLRRMPRLVFALDKDFERGERVLWLLDHMGSDPALSGPTDPPSAARGSSDPLPPEQPGD